MTENEIWNYLDSINVSKVFILFTAKYKKKTNTTELIIQSIMATTKCGKNNIDWEEDLYKEKSILTKPIYDEYQNFIGKADGMLVYDNEKKKAVFSGKIVKKIFENFRKEVTNIPPS